MILLLTLCSTARAWDSIGATWPADSFPVQWSIQGSVSGIADDEAEAAATAAFATWAAVDCAALSFTFAGRSTEATFGENDGQNVLFLVDANWPDEASLVSAPSVTKSGTEIVDADVAIDGVNYAFSTDGDGRTTMDLQATFTHEIGHMVGLWHSTDPDASLNPSLDGNPEARDLADDDLSGICELYGSNVGAGAFGDACATTDDCESDLFCLLDGDAQYCTMACADGDCPDGYECADVGDDAACALPAATSESCGCQAGDGLTPAAASQAAALLLLFGARRRQRA